MRYFVVAACLAAVLMAWAEVAGATVYEVGPGKAYSRIIDCPTHNLQAGDIIRVYRKGTPYRDKFLLHGVGTAGSPIKLQGVPDSSGALPELTGEDARTDTSVKYWNEDRQIVLIGQYDTMKSDYIIVENFVLHGANSHNTYYDDNGNIQSYATNACGVRSEYADHVTIRNCEIYGNENGVFNGSGDPQEITIENCYIHDNGMESPSSYLQHNIYMGSGGAGSVATVQYCRFGEMQNDGQQCKFRTETVIFRYNWVEGGRNSQLDIVEDASNGAPSNAYVYGNVIFKPADTNNGRIVHYGGDQGGTTRSGTCYFFNNTVIINNSSTSTRLFQISKSGCSVQANYNIFYRNTTGTVNVYDGYQNISGSYNWLSDGISQQSLFSDNVVGTDPGFVDFATKNFGLTAGSPCLDRVASPSFPAGHTLDKQYLPHENYEARSDTGNLDLGAFLVGGGLNIPTVGEWGMLLLGMGLALVAFRKSLRLRSC